MWAERMSVSPSAPSRLVRVAVAVPLADAFDYLWPTAGDLPPAGSRVRVPFGRRERIGVVLDHPSTTALSAEKLKSIREALDREPLIGAELMQTLRWAADYYHHPIGEVLNHALPSVLREGRALDEPPELVWQITELGREQSRERIARSARQQARALAALAERSLTASDLKLAAVGAATLARLAAKKWIEAVAAPGADSPPSIVSQELPELTSDQRHVIGAIGRGEDATFRAYLLHGVTGSGKTEVYLRLIARELAAGRQTLLLVPEIGLTPQLVGRLRARFGDELAVLHSGLTERERFLAWRSAHAGRAKLVVGTRSAVFAPLPAAGLIIVDEEHDPSYKQQRGFRYSARDLAVVRAQRLKIPVVLASATPSLESFHNASGGALHEARDAAAHRLGGSTASARARLEPARDTPSTIHAARERDRASSRRGQPGDAVLEPPRLCAGVVLRRVQERRGMLALRRAHDRAREGGGAALPSLRPGAAAALGLRRVRQRASRGGRRHATRRRRAQRAFPRGARRAPRSRCHEPQGHARSRARRRGERRDTDPDRHANADQGP